MLDLRWMLENEGKLREKLKARNNFPTEALDRILSTDSERRSLIQKVEAGRARKNAISKEIPQKKKAGEDIAGLMAEVPNNKRTLTPASSSSGGWSIKPVN